MVHTILLLNEKQPGRTSCIPVLMTADIEAITDRYSQRSCRMIHCAGNSRKIPGFRLSAAALLFFICFTGSAASAKELRIGVLYWSANIPGQVAMSRGLEQQAFLINQAASGSKPPVTLVRRVAGDGAAGITNQITQMRELIHGNVDLIIVQPTDNAALAEPLREANRAGIPVVAYDQYISGGTLSAYRTSDNYQAGFLDGEYISSKFSAGKEIKIVLVEYPHVSSTVERVDGFLDALRQYNRAYKILKSYSAVEPVSGKKAVQTMLSDFPAKGSVDVVFTVNDGGGLAVAEGLVAARRNEIMMATIDGDPASVRHIAAGRLIVIDSAQFCGALGAEAMKTAYSILTGGKPPYYALVPVFPVTRETLHAYPGWNGSMPADFKKPWESTSPQWHGSIRIVKP